MTDSQCTGNGLCPKHPDQRGTHRDADHVTYIEPPDIAGHFEWHCHGCRYEATGIETAREVLEGAVGHGPLAVDSPIPIDPLDNGGPSVATPAEVRAALAHLLGERIPPERHQAIIATLYTLPDTLRAQVMPSPSRGPVPTDELLGLVEQYGSARQIAGDTRRDVDDMAAASTRAAELFDEIWRKLAR